MSAAEPLFHIDLADLPVELLQEIMDWLPTFGSRARLNVLCSCFRGLEWRLAAPYHVEEELCNLSLGNIGTAAVSMGLLASQNAGLKELCLGGNDISDAGVEALAGVLASGKTNIRRLSLCDNRISDRGAAALAKALVAATSTLQELDLWGNIIGEVGRTLIIQAAKKCEVFLELPRLWPRSLCSQASFAFDPVTRTVLFDWVAQVHQKITTAIELLPDPQNMLLHTYSHIDAYLRECPVQGAELELVGLACTLVSTGLDRSSSDDGPECAELADWLALMSEGAYNAEHIQQAACEVRDLLGSGVHQPTVYTFLRRYLRQTGWSESSFCLANYLMELAALDASFLGFRPQAVAAAVAIISQQYAAQGVDVRSMPDWKARLLLCAGVDVRWELAPCAAALSSLHARSQALAGCKFVQKKYRSSKLYAVARLTANPPADTVFFEKLMRADAA